MSASHQAKYIDLLRGTELSATLTISLLSWFAYEYCVSFATEVEFFWIKREWTRGRVLFFINRYTTWLALIASLYVVLVSNPNIKVRRCTRSIYASLIVNMLCMCIGQMLVANKLWYLFQHRRDIRVSLASGLALSVSLSLVLSAKYVGDFNVLATMPIGSFVSVGCKAQPPASLWVIYIPPLLYHMYLHGLAVHLARLNNNLWDMSETTRKIFWDGCAINFVAFVTFLWTIILVSRTDTPSLSIPAAFSPVALVATSIAVARVSITIRMFLSRETSDLAGPQGSMGNVIELMPMDARSRRQIELLTGFRRSEGSLVSP